MFLFSRKETVRWHKTWILLTAALWPNTRNVCPDFSDITLSSDESSDGEMDTLYETSLDTSSDSDNKFSDSDHENDELYEAVLDPALANTLQIVPL